ncbi:MAG: ATP-binding protein [Micropepsaceae bacterium]
MRRALPALSPAQSRTIAALAAILVSWALLQWIDIRSPAIADLQMARLEMAPLSAPDIELAARAEYTLKDEPFRLDGNFVAARLTFQADNPASTDLAIFIRRVRDNYAVYVNGKLASPVVGEISATPTLDGAQPRLTKLLPSLIAPGKNTVHIICARNLSPPFLKEVYFGSASRLEPAYRHSIFVMRDIAEFALVAGAMVILFALALSAIIRNPALVLTIAITLSFFILRELHTLWLNVAWPQQFRDAYLLVTATAVWSSCAALVNEWTSGPRSLRLAFPAFGGTASILIAVAYVGLPIAIASEVTAAIETLVELVTFAFMSIRLFRYYAMAPASAVIEIFSALVCLIMAVASIITQTGIFPGMSDFLSVQGDAFVQFGALSIITFIAAGLARQGIDIYQMAALNNETLSRRVEEKEHQIQKHHANLQVQEAERVLLAERGRIMSDVHDGIGSQLLGLLIQARSGASKPETLVEGLQSALDDLYLVVDSLDTVEGALDTALGTFRTRIEPKCKAAGIKLKWSISTDHPAAVTSPTIALQICRILQEAASNAIRHGKATELKFALTTDQKQSVLCFDDNGTGFSLPGVTGNGRGLNNMRKRATAIGADLAIESSKAGTRVRITLPA